MCATAPGRRKRGIGAPGWPFASPAPASHVLVTYKATPNPREPNVSTAAATASTPQFLEIIAFKINDQSFCVKTRSIREIRGWAPATPIPHSPYEMLGVINLRGKVIPIIDLSVKLGMSGTQASERSAIIVTDVNDMTLGLLVEGVSDILTVPADSLQPVPQSAGQATNFTEGLLAHQGNMICFLNLEELFASGNSYAIGGGGGGGGGADGWQEF
ncbi:purine-binding chemotaxis protein CheW [Ciceribacter sp. L1K22]|nr:purine-binding chemotaxis protein CheW [Ciceribacter sp. L1K22]